MDKVLIIDFGSQFTQLIARRIRERHFFCVIGACDMTADQIDAINPQAIILSGSPDSVGSGDVPRIVVDILARARPVLGICYGQQSICRALGGDVLPHREGEYGRAELEVVADSPLFAGLWAKGKTQSVWMSHADRVHRLPPGFSTLARSDRAPHAVIGDAKRRIYGVQFHPEVSHTKGGVDLLVNFLTRIAALSPGWTMDNFLDRTQQSLRDQIGDKEVICAVSGGVDSTVSAALLHRAIKDRLHCIFVDTGLLRLGEVGRVKALFRDHLKMDVTVCDASDVFLDALQGVHDPEEKRKIIGKTFIDVFEKEAMAYPNATFLAQGTLYPDVIESAGGPRGGKNTGKGAAMVIKSHHNVGGLPENLKLGLVEPLRDLFKDEVRRLGRVMGLPQSALHLHPFPGPGLAVRIPGSVSRDKTAILRKADAIFLEEIEKAGLYDAIWQAFAVLLPVKSVGVMGDARSFDWTCSLRAITSSDGMTADVYPFDIRFLTAVASRIVNEVQGINRVLFDVTSKPPATIEWE